MKNVRQIGYYLKYSDYTDFKLSLSTGTSPALLNLGFRFCISGNLKSTQILKCGGQLFCTRFERTG